MLKSFDFCVDVLKLFLLSTMNVYRFGKDRVTVSFFWIRARAWHWQGKGLSNVVASKWCQSLWLWNWEAMSTIKHAPANRQACAQNCSGYSKWHKSRTSNDHLLATAEFLPVLVFSTVHDENTSSLPTAADFQMERWAKQKLFWGSSHSFSEILMSMFKT